MGNCALRLNFCRSKDIDEEKEYFNLEVNF